MLGQLLLQPGADGVVRQYLPGVDLGEPFLDFADEPQVLANLFDMAFPRRTYSSSIRVIVSQ